MMTAPAPDPAIVLDLIEAYRRSKSMFAAVELGVFDALSSGPQTALELATAVSAHADSLRRLLDACVALGLLSRDGDRYRNTDMAAAYLTTTSPRRFTGYIKYSNTAGWKLWEHLADAVRDGSHRWQQAYGWDGPIFSHFFRTEEAAHEFLMGMHGFGVLTSPLVAEAFDLGRFRTLADLGGATGHLVIACCERYPHLSGIVFDLPAVVPLAKQIVAASPAVNRIDVIAGDFFTNDLPPADLYALGRIIHDWSEDKIDRLLARIFAALPSGGGLLIAEKLLNDDRCGPRWALMQDLNMLTCTEGRERTLGDYRTILERAGFTNVQGRVTPRPIDAVLAIKP
ncbi:MAG TPA: class I SAM-dependent methyltransferase [Planctomycetaceae bacterium]|nr:class I SAM-dependent methyltransferase [Planctomycetaceae bacterium]